MEPRIRRLSAAREDWSEVKLPIRSYPPGRGNVMIPQTSRRGIVVGLDLHAPCRPSGVSFHRLARVAARVGGLSAVPGQPLEWKAPSPEETWNALLDAWRDLGDFDALAIYERTRPVRQGFSALLMRRGRSIAFIRVREHGSDVIGREHAVLRGLATRRPTAVRVPHPLAEGVEDGWAWLATEALPRGPYYPSLRPPLELISRDIGEALADYLPNIAVDPSWRPMHGDLSPWNLRRRRGLFLVDWEDAGWGPPGADEVYFEAAATVVCGRAARRDWSPAAVDFWINALTERCRSDPNNTGSLGMLELLKRSDGSSGY